MKWERGTSLNTELTQKQRQQMSFDQLQALRILQTAREDLSQLLMDISQENPFMVVEDTRDMLEINSLGFDNILIEDGVSQYDSYGNMVNSSDRQDNHQAMINQLEDQRQQSFRTNLIDQIMCYRKTRLRDLMIRLVDELNEDGFLSKSDEALQLILECDAIELLDAITLLQQLEPVGVGARDLRELWMLQTEQDPSAPEIAYVVLEIYFTELVNREYQTISNHLNVSIEDILETVAYYQTLAITPAVYFYSEETHYIEPDVFIQQKEEGYEVSYNFQNLPKLSFNDTYYQELKAIEDTDLKEFIKDKRQQVRAVLYSLKRREVTLVQVTQAIIEAQALFFNSKGHQVSPLTIKQIAERCDLSPSTVSRTIQGKYFYTDFGTFELRKLFTTSSVQSESGEELSQQFILKEIQKLINQEDKQHPLSDQKLTDILHERGYAISRRTVNKYRKELGILSTTKRRIK